MSATERRTPPDRLSQKSRRDGGPAPADVLQKFAHLQHEFAAAARAGARRLALERDLLQAASQRRQAPAVAQRDLICTAVGRVVAWAAYMIRIAAPVPAVRGGASTGITPPGGVPERWLRPLEGADIQIGWLQEDGVPWLEFNLLQPHGGVEIRPFTVEVRDPGGRRLQAPVLVSPGMLPPLFPSPSPGTYCFLVRWDGGAGEMSLEVRPEDGGHNPGHKPDL